MPKDLKEFDQLEEVESRQGGKKVDWANVAQQIIDSNEMWTVKEVWEKFAKKAVTLFRTKGALDNLVEKKVLTSRYDGKRFWYCRPMGGQA